MEMVALFMLVSAHVGKPTDTVQRTEAVKVGSFRDLKACQDAANTAWFRGGSGFDPGILWVCVNQK
jgi:hypothetical protein